MKKTLTILCAAAVLTSLFAPTAANARDRHHSSSDIYIVNHDRDRDRWDRRHNRWDHHNEWRPLVNLLTHTTRPYNHYRHPPRVVYETVVQPVPQYVVVPTPMPVNYTYPVSTSSYGQPCRNYTATTWVSGQLQNVYGTACLHPDGVWRTVN